MKILERSIAITDVETTGLDPTIQEIVEIGLVLVNQQTLGKQLVLQRRENSRLFSFRRTENQ